MKVLLDTHALLWYYQDSPELSDKVKELVADESSDVAISVASFWEIGVKLSVRKLELGEPFEDFADTVVYAHKFKVLGIELPHIAHISRLPMHHRDPFDRMIIAQSFCEEMPVVTVDLKFERYGVATIW